MRPCIYFVKSPATTEIYTLSLHDALPICLANRLTKKQSAPDLTNFIKAYDALLANKDFLRACEYATAREEDRKSTRLNSSHITISYAVFCLKKKMTRVLIVDDDASTLASL